MSYHSCFQGSFVSCVSNIFDETWFYGVIGVLGDRIAGLMGVSVLINS